MTVVENILANARRFFGMENATDAELDQHLEEQLTDEADSDESEQEASAEETDEGQEQETAAESDTQESAQGANLQAILTRLNALESENSNLREKVKNLNEKHLAAAAQYEEETAEADPRDAYLCSTTLRAMGS
jgi:hypothetical protein